MKKYFVMIHSHNRLRMFILCFLLAGLSILAWRDQAIGVRVSDDEVSSTPSTQQSVVSPPTQTKPTNISPSVEVLPEVTLPKVSAQDTTEFKPQGVSRGNQLPVVEKKESPKPSPQSNETVDERKAPDLPAPVASGIPKSTPTASPAEKTADITKAQKTVEKKEEPPKEDRSVTIDFDNVDILLFVKFISEVTGKNFIVDEKVKGKVTIISPTKISVEEAYRVFLSVLEVHGFTVIDSGQIIKVVPSVEARGKSIETYLKEEAVTPDDRVVTQLIRLKYANPDELKKLFAPLISKNSVIVAYPPSGMLIITDVLSNVMRILNIIQAIDVVGVGEEINVVPLEHANAATLLKSLTSVFQSSKTAAKKKGLAAVETDINMVADDRTNSLIISASEYDTSRVKALIKILDQEIPRGMGNIWVHYLQYADAEELAKVLMALPKEEGAKGGEEKGKAVAPVISKSAKIMADKSTNSLVITTDKQDYLTLTEVISKLDIPRSMVYIEALIMEVKTTKEFEIGTEWRVGDDSIGTYDGKTYGGWAGSVPGTSTLPSSTNLALPAGVSLGVLGEAITIGGVTFPSLGAIARAFQSDSDVHILQTPQILTTDNEEAEIQVTDNIPYLTKEATGDQDYQTYEYRDVGLKLKITPQINRDRFVRLKISQEYSTVSSAGDTPTTLKRAATTTVIVKDTESVVIGGLVGDQISRATSGVPCLANIPVLGWAFKSYSRDQDKTNLFIFLTPYVVQGPEEAKKVYEQKKANMDRVEEGVIKMYQRTQPPIAPTELMLEQMDEIEEVKTPQEIDTPQENEASEENGAPQEPEEPTTDVSDDTR